jgi:hypothetical protein
MHSGHMQELEFASLFFDIAARFSMEWPLNVALGQGLAPG